MLSSFKEKNTKILLSSFKDLCKKFVCLNIPLLCLNCLVFLVDHMEVDPDALQAGRSAGVEPGLPRPHRRHLQPRHGVAPVGGEQLPGQV